MGKTKREKGQIAREISRNRLNDWKISDVIAYTRKQFWREVQLFPKFIDHIVARGVKKYCGTGKYFRVDVMHEKIERDFIWFTDRTRVSLKSTLLRVAKLEADLLEAQAQLSAVSREDVLASAKSMQEAIEVVDGVHNQNGGDIVVAATIEFLKMASLIHATWVLVRHKEHFAVASLWSVYLIQHLIHLKSIISFVTGILALCGLAGVVIVNHVVDKVGEKVPVVEEQGGGEKEILETGVRLFSAMAGKTPERKFSPIGYVRDFNTLATMGKNLEWVSKKLGDFFFTIIGLAYEWWTGVKYVPDKWRVWYTEFETMHDEFISTLTVEGKKHSEVAISSVENRKFVLDMNLKLEEHLKQGASELNVAGCFLDPIREFKTKVFNPVYQAVLSFAKIGEPRVQPIWIHLYGPPGVGKSFCIPALAAAFFHYYKPDHQVSNGDIYIRRIKGEKGAFWDGYVNQEVLVYNEAWQSTDVDDRRQISQELIDLVGPEPYALLMADLADKGTTFFNGKLIITLSNESDFPDNLGITDPSAIARRMFPFEVSSSHAISYTDRIRSLKFSPKIVARVDNAKGGINKFFPMAGVEPMSLFSMMSSVYMAFAQNQDDAMNAFKALQSLDWDSIDDSIGFIPRSTYRGSKDDISKHFDGLTPEQIKSVEEWVADPKGRFIVPPVDPKLPVDDAVHIQQHRIALQSLLDNHFAVMKERQAHVLKKEAGELISLSTAEKTTSQYMDQILKSRNNLGRTPVVENQTDCYVDVKTVLMNVKGFRNTLVATDREQPIPIAFLLSLNQVCYNRNDRLLPKTEESGGWWKLLLSDYLILKSVGAENIGTGGEYIYNDRLLTWKVWEILFRVPLKNLPEEWRLISGRIDNLLKKARKEKVGYSGFKWPFLHVTILRAKILDQVTEDYNLDTWFQVELALKGNINQLKKLFPPIKDFSDSEVVNVDVSPFKTSYRTEGFCPPLNPHKDSDSEEDEVFHDVDGTVYVDGYQQQMAEIQRKRGFKDVLNRYPAFSTWVGHHASEDAWNYVAASYECTLDELTESMMEHVEIRVGAWVRIMAFHIQQFWGSVVGVTLAGIISASAIVGSVWGFLSREQPKHEQEPEEQSDMVKAKVAHKKLGKQYADIVNQGSNNLDLVPAIKNNIVPIWLETHEIRFNRNYGFFLGGRVMITVSHFFYGTEENAEWLGLSRGTLDCRFHIKDLEIIKVPDKDITVVKFPKAGFNQFPDVTHHLFPTQSYLSGKNVVGISLIERDSKDNVYIHNFSNALISADDWTETRTGGFNKGIGKIPGADTKSGMCGLPYLITNNGVQFKLGLFHFAKSTTSVGALATIVSQEDVRPYMIENQCREEFPEVKVCSPDPIPPSTMCIGELEKGAHMPTESTIVASPILCFYNHTPTTAPVRLRPFVNSEGLRVSPLRLQQRKFLHEFHYARSTKFYDNIVNDLIMMYRDPARPCYYRNRTWEEVLEGDPCLEMSHSVALDSSAGYPWSIKGKRRVDLVKRTVDGTVTLVDDFKQEIERKHDLMKRNVIPNVIYIDMLKDERRDLERVAAGKTRIFGVGPFDWQVITRKYSMDIFSHIDSRSADMPISVGINPHSASWGVVWRRLRKHPNVGAGDFSAHDLSARNVVTERFATFLHKLMIYANQDEADLVAKMLGIIEQADEHCLRLVGAILYWMDQGNPSGSGHTSVRASFITMFVLYAAFVILARINDKPATMNAFRRNVELACYGDDNVFSVSNEYKFYNMVTIGEVLGEVFGMVYTTPDKKENTSEFMRWEDVTYLKRKFVEDEGLILAPLEADVIRDMVCFVTDKNNAHRNLNSTINTAVIEWAMHGRAVFNEEIYRLNCAIAQCPGIHPITVTWEDVIRNYKSTY